MAQRISNEVLAGLLFIAIVISLIGTFSVWQGFPSITGRQADSVDTSTASFAITAITAIEWTYDNIDWGAGSVIGTNNSAELNSNDSCSGNVPRGSWECNQTDLLLRNIGSERCNLTISSNQDNVSLLGGTAAWRGFQWYFWETNNSCYGTLTSEEAYGNIIKDTNVTLCTGFNFSSTDNQIFMDLNITIPRDATETGTRTTIFIATATTMP